ncbi:MAG: peptide chain release factor N(5)-glutamine methyltransferase [Proteobacteria bacterium]|nr:MAG: peptide chain release factor N(5)-glutamine methyltransferase [Pseudomonadota bacterium]
MSTAQEIWTIKDVLTWSIGFLQKSGSESPRLDAEVLLAESLSCRRLDLYLTYDKPLEVTERNRYKDLIRRRAQGEPVAYITGKRDFFGLTLNVSPKTLIPRPDTETLVEAVLDKTAKDSLLRVLDIGTGTGCIALALKNERKGWDVSGWDISPEALLIAESNALKHELNVPFFAVDALNPSTWAFAARQKFDVIVSNPPYICESEVADMNASALKFEPRSALFADDNGLQFYALFAQKLPDLLSENGKVFLEIGFRQRDAVCSLLEEAGWREVRSLKDLSGHDRVVTASSPLL